MFSKHLKNWIEKLRTKYETEMDQLKKRLEEEKKVYIN